MAKVKVDGHYEVWTMDSKVAWGDVCLGQLLTLPRFDQPALWAEVIDIAHSMSTEEHQMTITCREYTQTREGAK